MHSSQPVHCSSTTVCICLDAPTMQSTGQALMHTVQPTQPSSWITACMRTGSASLAAAVGSTPSTPASASRASSTNARARRLYDRVARYRGFIRYDQAL